MTCSMDLDITRLRQAVIDTRAEFHRVQSLSDAPRAQYDGAFNRLMKAYKEFNTVRIRKIEELGLDIM